VGSGGLRAGPLSVECGEGRSMACMASRTLGGTFGGRLRVVGKDVGLAPEFVVEMARVVAEVLWLRRSEELCAGRGEGCEVLLIGKLVVGFAVRDGGGLQPVGVRGLREDEVQQLRGVGLRGELFHSAGEQTAILPLREQADDVRDVRAEVLV